MLFVSSISAHSSPGQSPSILAGRAGEALEAEGVGQPLGRVDRDDHGPPAGPGRLERQHGGGGGLADAAGAAAHEDAALLDELAEATAGALTRPPGGASISREEPIGQQLELGRADLGGEHERQAELRQRELLGQAGDLLRPAGRCGRPGTRPRRPAPSASPSRRVVPGGVGRRDGIGVDARRGRRSTPFTTTGPRPTPTRSSRLKAVSTSSLTGVSSGRVTSITRQRSWSVSISSTSWAWALIGPTRTVSSRTRAAWRNVMAWPAAGSVEDRAGRPRPIRSSCFTLPRMRMSLMPGRGGGHHVEGAGGHQALRDAGQAVVPEVVEERLVRA